MYISAQKLDDETVLVVGYDPQDDPKWEMCAVFQALRPENTVQLISRHLRNHLKPEICELPSWFEDSELENLDKALPRFYAMAMKSFGFVPHDDSLPAEQKDLPFQDGPQP